MSHAEEFDRMYAQLSAQLSAMTAEEFFGSFGMRLDELPDRPQTEYSRVYLNSCEQYRAAASFHDSVLDLKCA